MSIFCFFTFTGYAQNMMFGSHFSLVRDIQKARDGYGGGVRMGLLLFGSEMGFKAFYSRLVQEEIDSEIYGISTYSSTKLLKEGKIELHGFLEGGMSFSFREVQGSEITSQIGIAPVIRYWIGDIVSIELLSEYLLLGTIKTNSPNFQHLFIPSISFSVKI